MKLNLPRLIDIDQKDQFEEITEFRDNLVKEWGLDLIVARNGDFLTKAGKMGNTIPVSELNTTNQKALSDIGYNEPTVTWEPESPVCNHLLKT